MPEPTASTPQLLRVSGVTFALDHRSDLADAVVHQVVDETREAVPFFGELTDDSFEMRMDDALMRLDRGTPHLLRIETAAPLAEDGLIHPFLSLPAAVIQQWCGRLVLHASAFDVGGKAVVLLGHREAGKSTTVAAALEAGFAVRADDVVVLDGDHALPGTSVIDLREPASVVFGGRALGRIGSRDRWRIYLDEPQASVPVAAFVRLSWGDDVRVSELGAAELVSALYSASALGDGHGRHLRHRPRAVLDLLDIRCLELQRPRDLNQLPGAVMQLADLVAAG
ncbi:MAG: hypothetical protein ACOYL9_13310 [Ilumatobacteraceae bacterium]